LFQPGVDAWLGGRVHTFLLNCIKNKPFTYADYMVHKLGQLSNTNIFTNYATHKLNNRAFRIEKIEYAVFHVSFGVLYGYIIIDLILIIFHWIKSKQTPWLKIVLWLIITGQLTVAVAGGYSEYPRLILAAIPALVISLFYDVDLLWSRMQKGKPGLTTANL
jgi:hypothetical protein